MEENSQPDTKFYKDAVNYWSDIPATVDGMLGGYGHISDVDIEGSRTFLKRVFSSLPNIGKNRALDCGAGIGRITKDLLTTLFKTVDLVEQNSAFLDEARLYLQPKINKIGHFYPVGLQDFKPEEKYDVIWTQWVLGHLKDDHLIDFFEKCKYALANNGVIVVKENVTSTSEVEVDDVDSSVTRPYKLLIEIFEKAGLKVHIKVKQPHFPKELYGVYMFALYPKDHVYH